MPRGAPQGNQYAKKATRRRGLTVSHYIRADVYEFLRECLDFETGDSSEEAIRKRVSELTEQAINEDLRRMFALYKASHDQSPASLT